MKEYGQKRSRWVRRVAENWRNRWEYHPEKREFLEAAKIFGAASVASFGVGLIGEMILFESIVAGGDQYLADDKNSYVPLPPIDIAGKNLELVGVSHAHSVFAKHEHEIEQQIVSSNSPFVFLEYFDESTRQRAQPVSGNIAEHLAKDYPPHEYNDYLYNFFGGIGSICAREDKDVIVVNPEGELGLGLLIDTYLITGVLPALVVSDAAQLVRKLRGTDEYSRRNILRAAGYTAGSFSLASWISDLSKSSVDNRGENHVDSWRWNLVDWRDCLSALGISKAFEEFESEIDSESTTQMFQGRGHNGMLGYLANPELARDKANWFYRQYQLLGDQSIRRYSYDKKEKQWKEVANIKI